MTRYSNVLFATLNGRNRTRNVAGKGMSNFGTINIDNFGTKMNAFAPAQGVGPSRDDINSKVISTTVETYRVKFTCVFLSSFRLITPF